MITTNLFDKIDEKIITEIPKYIKAGIMSSFSGQRNSNGFFVVWNDDSTMWLANSIGIYSSGNSVVQINNSFVVFWRWDLQRFQVRA